MSKKIIILILLIANCGVALSTTPDSTSNKVALTLDDALHMGLNDNAAVRAGEFNRRAAEQLKKAAFGLRLPKLSASANYTYMSDDILNIDLNGQKDKLVGALSQLPLPIPPALLQGLKEMDLSYTLQKRDFAMVSGQLLIPIYTGGKINAANNVAKINLQRAQLEQQQTATELFTEISERYWGLALAQSVEQLQNDVVHAMELHSSNAEQLEKNGIIARTERLFVQMNLASSKAAYQTAQSNTKSINTALCGSLAGVNVQFVPVTTMFINPNIEPLEYFKKQAAENSHALEQVELVRRLSKEMVRAERAAFMPEVAAIGAANVWNYNLTDHLPTWIIGAGVKLSIFDGLTREYKFSAAKNQVRRVEALQEKAQIDIAILVEKLYGQMTAALAQVQAMQNTIDFAQEYLVLKQKSFAEGLCPASDVVDAELNLAKSRTQRLAAAYNFDISLANILALCAQTNRFESYQISKGYEPIN